MIGVISFQHGVKIVSEWSRLWAIHINHWGRQTKRSGVQKGTFKEETHTARPNLTSCEVVVNLLPLCGLAEGHGCFCWLHRNTQESIFHINTLHWLVQRHMRGWLKCQGQDLDSQLVTLKRFRDLDRHLSGIYLILWPAYSKLKDQGSLDPQI